MRFVQMGGYDNLIAVAQKPLCQLHANGVGLLRRDLSGGKGLDHMIAFSPAVSLAPAPFRVHHVLIDALTVTVDGCFKAGAFCFFTVQCVVNGGFQ